MDINITLDPKSISNAIRELNAYKKKLVKDTQKLVETLIENGVEIARLELVAMDAVDTSELYNSINAYYSPLLQAGFIKVNCDYAVFVEFGTGVNNQRYPDPQILAKAKWNYGSGKHIFTTLDGRTGWFFPADNGKYYFTEGMSSRPFMLNTALTLEKRFSSIARGVFK